MDVGSTGDRSARSQAHASIPEDAWEYHIRASLKDAAYKGLDFVPYCSTMPCKPESEDVKFMWVRVPIAAALHRIP